MNKYRRFRHIYKKHTFTIALVVLVASIITIFSHLAGPKEAQAEPTPEEYEAFYECIAPSLVDYMQTILDAQLNDQLSDQVLLLSPAFNMTSFTFQGIVGAMGPDIFDHPNLVGIAGNIYNYGYTDDDGNNAIAPMTTTMEENGINAFLDQHPNLEVFITESGNTENGGSNAQTIDEIEQMLFQHPEIQQLCLFNPTGSNPDPNFTHHHFDDAELNDLCNRVDCSRLCINYGTGHSAGTDDDNNHGFNGAVQIGEGGNVAGAISAITSNENGTNIIRIGTGDGSGGFDEAQDYIDYLNDIAEGLPEGTTFYAIAGPNEPDLEYWLAPWCALEHLNVFEACGGQLEWNPVGYRGEVVGHNNELPWSISSNVRDEHEKGNDLSLLAGTLSVDMIITVPNYWHTDFEPMSQQLTGSLDGSKNSVEERSKSMLFANIPFINTYHPGTIIPHNFRVGPQEGRKVDENETYEAFAKRVFKTSATKDGTELGAETDMPTLEFRACIQRTSCDPSIEENCLSATPEEGECTGSDPDDCVSSGTLFSLNGRIEKEEPPDLHSTSRGFDLLKKSMVDVPGKVYTMENIFTTEEINQGYYASIGIDEDTYLEKYYASNPGKEKPNPNEFLNSPTNLEANNRNNKSNPLNPNAANAENEPTAGTIDPYAQPSSNLSVYVQDNGSTVSIEYEYCIWHDPNSSCSIRDVSSTINGVEIIIWTGSTLPGSAKCLKPGWGGAPSFEEISLGPGECTQISAGSRGGRVGSERCSDTLAPTACNICREADGTVTQTCDEMPEPPPVDCRVCNTWAPDFLCQPIIAPKLPTETECVGGEPCRTSGLKIEDKIPIKSDDWNISWDIGGWIQAFINTFGNSFVDCSRKTREDCVLNPVNGVESCSTETVGWDCGFGAKDYLIYAYPTSAEGDFKDKSVSMIIHNAMFKNPDQTSAYFVPRSTKAPLNLQLILARPRATGFATLPGDFSWGAADPENKDDISKRTFYIGLNDAGIRQMYIEYDFFFAPQTSGQCLKQKFLSHPIPGKEVPISHNALCAEQPFWGSSGTTSSLDSQIGNSNNYNGDIANVNPETDNQGPQWEIETVTTAFDLENEVLPKVNKIIETTTPSTTSTNPEYKIIEDRINQLTPDKKEQLYNELKSDVEAIIFKHQDKLDKNDPSYMPPEIETEFKKVSRRYVQKYGLL